MCILFGSRSSIDWRYRFGCHLDRGFVGDISGWEDKVKESGQLQEVRAECWVLENTYIERMGIWKRQAVKKWFIKWKVKLNSVLKVKQESFKKEAKENRMEGFETTSLEKRFRKPLITWKFKFQYNSIAELSL